MIISNHDKAAVLIQALPYIQKYTGKTVVIKYGGNAMVNEDLKEAVISDIVLLSLVGINTVLVHGGGPEISQMLKKTRQGVEVHQRTALHRRRDYRHCTNGARRKD